MKKPEKESVLYLFPALLIFRFFFQLLLIDYFFYCSNVFKVFCELKLISIQYRYHAILFLNICKIIHICFLFLFFKFSVNTMKSISRIWKRNFQFNGYCTDFYNSFFLELDELAILFDIKNYKIRSNFHKKPGIKRLPLMFAKSFQVLVFYSGISLRFWRYLLRCFLSLNILKNFYPGIMFFNNFPTLAFYS